LYVVLVDLPHHGVPASCGGHLRNSAHSLRTFGPPDNHQPTETMQHHFSPTSFFQGSAVSASRHYNKTRGKAATSITMILRDESFRTSSGPQPVGDGRRSETDVLPKKTARPT
jgi:hypothetical protein